jgi:protein TonB
MQRRWLALSFVAWTGVAAASGPGLLAEPLPRIPTPEEGARLDALAFAETFVNQVVRDQGYPAEALALGLEGTVRVTVVIGPDGRVKAASVAASSGHPLLDAEAVRKVRDAESLPVPPALLRGREFSLVLPISFRLGE